MCSVDIIREYIYIYTGGALSARKKSNIQQNLLFEDPGWERLENLKYRNFWSCQVFSGSSHALAALSITEYEKGNLGWRYEKGNPKKLGDMPELNSHNSWKQVCNIFLVETKNKTQISRKFADICFNHFKTNISGMCGHGPKNSRSRLSIFYFHRTNSPNPWRPDLKENEAVGAAIWQNHLSHFFGFIAIFVFHRVFSNQDGPSRFFPALGFRKYILIHYTHTYIYIMYPGWPST